MYSKWTLIWLERIHETLGYAFIKYKIKTAALWQYSAVQIDRDPLQPRGDLVLDDITAFGKTQR